MFVHNKTPRTHARARTHTHTHTNGEPTTQCWAACHLSSQLLAPGDRTRFPLINRISFDTAANSLELFYAEKNTKRCLYVTEIYTLRIKCTLVLILDDLKQTFKVTNTVNINV